MQKILLSFFTIFLYATTACSSRSFFRPRDVSTDNALELSLANYQRYHAACDNWFNFFLKPFYMESTNCSKLARYFLPNNKACIRLDESGQGDVNPLWLNLIAPAGTLYTSNVSLCPKRKVGGVLFTAYLNLTNRLWLGLNTAVMQVRTTAGLTETNRIQAGTLPNLATAYDAFNNQTWSAGKISSCYKKAGGFDDIQLKLGYDFYKTCNDHATVYLVGTIPTGTRPKSLYLFEPLVGSNHGSFGVGFDGDALVYDCSPRHTFNLMLDVKYRYIFAANECRSFDLCPNGDWSRYLLVVQEAQPFNSQQAINILTGPVRVTPGNTVDLWLAAHYRYCEYLNIEIGYDFWWRDCEKLCKKCPIATGYGIQSLALCNLPLTTASTATIAQGPVAPNATVVDAQFIPITDAQINLNSAAHPSAHSSKLYATVGFNHEHTNVSTIWGFGGSYEFAAKNALQQWAVWLMGGVSF